MLFGVRCDNCGSMIPYHGKVCPHCNADKAKGKASSDFQSWLLVMAGVGGFVGMWMVFTIQPAWFCLGIFWGMIAGLLVGWGVWVARERNQ